MMMYRIFYNREAVGDVLLIVFDAFKQNDKMIKSDNVVSMYCDNKLIGINILNFSSIVRIHSKGMVVAPSREFINIINHILTNASLPILPEIESGFKVGKIVALKVHPKNNKYHCLKVDIGEKVLSVVSNASNLKIGSLVVVATPFTMMFDGSLIVPSVIMGEQNEALLCSHHDLKENNLLNDAIIELDESHQIGEDYF